jgi:hypothetical protein
MNLNGLLSRVQPSSRLRDWKVPQSELSSFQFHATSLREIYISKVIADSVTPFHFYYPKVGLCLTTELNKCSLVFGVDDIDCVEG